MVPKTTPQVVPRTTPQVVPRTVDKGGAQDMVPRTLIRRNKHKTSWAPCPGHRPGHRPGALSWAPSRAPSWAPCLGHRLPGCRVVVFKSLLLPVVALAAVVLAAHLPEFPLHRSRRVAACPPAMAIAGVYPTTPQVSSNESREWLAALSSPPTGNIKTKKK